MSSPAWEIYKRSRLDMEVFDRSVRFISVDLFVLAEMRPEYVQGLLRKVFSYFESGYFSPPPITVLPIGEIEEAFKLIQTLENNNRLSSPRIRPPRSWPGPHSFASGRTGHTSWLVAWEISGGTSAAICRGEGPATPRRHYSTDIG